LGLNVSDNTYDGLMGIASSLAGISNPDQAKALIAQQAAMKKVAGDHRLVVSHPHVPERPVRAPEQQRPHDAPPGQLRAPKDDEYDKAAKIAGAKSNQDYGDMASRRPRPTPMVWPATSRRCAGVLQPGCLSGHWRRVGAERPQALRWRHWRHRRRKEHR
jgi:hypothetical protein